MSALVIAGDTSGTITIEAPAVAGTNTITLPASTGTLLDTNSSLPAANLTGTIAGSALPAGSILQVLSTIKTDTFTVASATYTAVTGLNVTITPSSASSKILVMVQANVNGPSDNVGGFVSLRRGASTDILVGDSAGSRTQASANNAGIGDALSTLRPATLVVLDSPSTTSATTYGVYVRSPAAVITYVNRSSFDADNAYYPRTASTITVMEVAG
jgi:hypothetical protein